MDDNEDIRKKFTRIELFAQAQEYLKLKQSDQKIYNPYYQYQSANYFRNHLINIAYYVDEIFIPIKDYPNYLISNYGRVYSLSQSNLCKGSIRNSYRCIGLTKDYIHYKTFYIHRLIMLSFNYFDGCENYVINHIDGNKLNNYFNPISPRNNLEWCTIQQNTQHAFENNLINVLQGENTPKAIHTDKEINDICLIMQNHPEYSVLQLAKELNMPYNQSFENLIADLKREKNWKHITKNYNLPKPNSLFIMPNELIHEICKLLEKGISAKEIINILHLDHIKGIERKIYKIRSKDAYKEISDQYSIDYQKRKQPEYFDISLIHEICKLLEKRISIAEILNILHLEDNVNNRAKIGKLKLKKIYKDIVSQYNY